MSVALYIDYCSVIDRRKANPVDKKDLLSLMLEGKDPKTGESLPEKNVMHNVR